MSNSKNWLSKLDHLKGYSVFLNLMYKCRSLISEVVTPLLIKFGVIGAKTVGITINGNMLLQLNKDSALGSKGTILEIPRDKVIFEFVRRKGLWELEESQFIAQALKSAHRRSNSSKIALIDIGANTGLVTLQALNLAKTKTEVFLFEPIPRHISAIKRNLGHFSNIHLNEFALSYKNGQSQIFTESTNHGNSSLLNSVVPKNRMISNTIKIVQTEKFFARNLNKFASYVIKCDTQGMDALILSRIPRSIWKKCESAVVEIWSIKEIRSADVDKLLDMWKDFQFFNWHPDFTGGNIKLDEIKEFWLKKSGKARNLFLSKFPSF